MHVPEAELPFMRVQSLDDLLQRVLSRLLALTNVVSASKGAFRELVGVAIELTDPRARLSQSEEKGKLVSALGEFVWYASGSDATDFIKCYIPQYPTVVGEELRVKAAYGPRLFGADQHAQIAHIIELLHLKSTSRRAVAQLFGAEDLQSTVEFARVDKKSWDVPCTGTLQFLVRDGHLDLIACMRSNDAFVGLPHDIFCFTMIQEVVARAIAAELGSYRHFVGSLHLYEKDTAAAQRYVTEGWQRARPMPPMPEGDPRSNLDILVAVASEFRTGTAPADISALPSYWQELATLLRIHLLSKARPPHEAADYIDHARRAMTTRAYDPYLQDRVAFLRAKARGAVDGPECI